MRLIQLTEAITRTEATVDTATSSPRIRWRRDISSVLMTQRSGVRFIAPQGMIWKNAKHSWIRKRCDHQEPRRVDQRRADSEGYEQMGEINVIFGGSMSITSKTQGKKLQHEISLPQRIEPGRRMRWSDGDISFGLEDHPDTELSDRNLPFIVKILIRCHKVAKTLIDSGASLNLMMRKTFIEMGLNLAELTPVHGTFHGIISG
jgi:hypothetical protein